MTDKELQELRQWAAEVCGYKTYRGTEYHRPKGDDYEYVHYTNWLPDQNTSQAFEVLDTIRMKLGTGIEYEIGSNVQDHYALFTNHVWSYCENPNRCLAILLTCKKAMEQKP